MGKITATTTVERGSDGTYTALAVIGKNSIFGDGLTQEEAIEDLRKGAETLFEYLKSKGEPLPQSLIDLVSIDG